MEWYKHFTSSHDDPDISDAMDKFGDFGYSGFFILLDLYGQEFNHIDEDGYLKISKCFVQRKLRKRWTKVELLLNFFEKEILEPRFLWIDNGQFISLKVPKFIEIASNWSGRKTRKDLQRPYIAPTAKEVEVDKEEKKKKKIPPLVPPQPPTDEPAIFINLPLNDKSEYPITVTVIAEMKSLFPAVDIEQEFRGMRAWCLANSGNLKTRKGIKAFYTRWLSTEQDRARKVNTIPAYTAKPEPATPAIPKTIPKTDEKLHARFAAKVIAPMYDEINEQSWKICIEPLRAIAFDKVTNQITLYADSNIMSWVKDHYLQKIVALAGCNVRLIDCEE